MPIETIEFNGVLYPAIQGKGGASLWIREIANQYCDGIGLDIGYSKPEWKYPMAVGVDESLNNGYHAMNLPDSKDCDLHNEAYGWPFIHSSHCLEHVKENWYNVLDYWLTKIKVGGIIFLYLPHKSQEYWLPKNNRKHIHSFDGSEIADYLHSLGHKVMRSGVDFNHSFVVVCEKVDYVDDTEKLFRAARVQEEIMAADGKEAFCKERNLSYIREGNNVIYNEQSCIRYDIPDTRGDILMKGCFDKSIKENDFILTNHMGNEKTYQTFAELEKDIKEEENRQSVLATKKQQCNIIGAFLDDFNRDKIRLDDMLTAIYNAGKNSAL